MKLILMRHGEAYDDQLSQHGENQAHAVGNRLHVLGFRPTTIYHSSKSRARKTAQIVAQALGGADLCRPAEGLTPNASIEPWISRLEKIDQDVMLVSHLPFLKALTVKLLNDRCAIVPAYPTARVVILERKGSGLWRLEDTI